MSKFILSILFLIISSYTTHAQDCSSIVINDCSRTFCDKYKVIEHIPNESLCQYLCLNLNEFDCQSYAYSQSLKVIIYIRVIRFGVLLAKIICI